MKTFKCLLCGKTYTQELVPETCSECGADTTDFEVTEIEGFKASGKWPPVPNDVIYFPTLNGFGFVKQITPSNTTPVIDLKALIYDYRAESGGIEIEQPSAFGAVIENNNKMNDSLYLRLRQALDEKNLKFNYASGKVEYSPKRLSAGGHYYFINDKLMFEGATDDLGTVHTQRFAQGNYFPDSAKTKIGDKILVLVRTSAQKYALPNGGY